MHRSRDPQHVWRHLTRSRTRRATPRSHSAANWSLKARSSWASSTSPKSRRVSPWLARCPAPFYEAAVLSKGSMGEAVTAFREISCERGGCCALVGCEARARCDLHSDPCEPVIAGHHKALAKRQET